MQRLGYNVSPVHTVLFSNHTGYGDWGGEIIDTKIVSSVIDGIEKGVYSQLHQLLFLVIWGQLN